MPFTYLNAYKAWKLKNLLKLLSVWQVNIGNGGFDMTWTLRYLNPHAQDRVKHVLHLELELTHSPERSLSLLDNNKTDNFKWIGANNQ